MANFNTHVSIAAAGSGLLATLCLQIGFVNRTETLLLLLGGTIGGILPDIDLQRSHPSKIMFSLLGLVIAFIGIFSWENRLSIVELWIAGIVLFLTIRYPIWMIFHRFTKHRGSIHSVVSALLAFFCSVIASHHIFGKPAFVAWLFGFFVFLGFILHLLLDEIYSVDFSNYRIKRSFGSALKIIDLNYWKSSLMITSLALIAWFFTPDIYTFVDTLSSTETWKIIQYRLLP